MPADSPLPAARPPVPATRWDGPGLPDLGPALEAASSLGAWAHDWPADRLGLAAPLAERLGLPPGERAGVPLARVLARIHGEDRPRVEALLCAVREAGGPFEAEFRLADRGGWLRLAGRAGPVAPGRGRTCGLAFDITGARLGSGGPDRRAQWQVNQVAGHLIALRGLLSGLDEPPLERLLDAMMVGVARALARRLEPGGPGKARH